MLKGASLYIMVTIEKQEILRRSEGVLPAMNYSEGVELR
ncbi:hypothetical Protein YC6258_00354 [Gynuella sunshinyii YC6258]|uniref:Uncharacterized protein n=1 Tax=Gynuella sunshinyii YC6258 TaxID=1445510 RepID=A0A0C5VQ44_9GAMM|nr:hypothetical Protein YC6258_00354 [Gynuella sunshinyii YC6258]